MSQLDIKEESRMRESGMNQECVMSQLWVEFTLFTIDMKNDQCAIVHASQHYNVLALFALAVATLVLSNSMRRVHRERHSPPREREAPHSTAQHPASTHHNTESALRR